MFFHQDSAYTLYDRDFLSNLGSVLLFAVVGTLFNVFLIGYGLYYAASFGLMGSFGNETQLNSIEALIFSSLISAVDPVTLQTLPSFSRNYGSILFFILALSATALPLNKSISMC